LLHHACTCGLERLAGFLLAKGADPDASNSAGITPLHQAAKFGQVREQNYLCNCIIHPDTVTSIDDTCPGRMIKPFGLVHGKFSVTTKIWLVTFNINLPRRIICHLNVMPVKFFMHKLLALDNIE